jgi:hypothetical protein
MAQNRHAEPDFKAWGKCLPRNRVEIIIETRGGRWAVRGSKRLRPPYRLGADYRSSPLGALGVAVFNARTDEFPRDPRCRSLDRLYQRICPYGKPLSYQQCRPEDSYWVLKEKSDHWCRCSRLSQDFQDLCAPFGPPDPNHWDNLLKKRRMCNLCLDRLSIDYPDGPPQIGGGRIVT